MTYERLSPRGKFLSMVLLTGVASTGCVDAPQPTSAEGAAPTANHIVITSENAPSSIPWQMAPSQWAADTTTPGVWTRSAHGVTTKIRIAALANAAGEAAPLASCTLAHYIGPSSPVVPDLIGEAAIGQVDCPSSTGRFFIITEACSDLVPDCESESDVGNASPGAPFTVGVAVAGTAGADCSGHVAFFPPSFTGGNPCG